MAEAYIPSSPEPPEGSTVVRSADFSTLPFCPAVKQPASQSAPRNHWRHSASRAGLSVGVYRSQFSTELAAS